MAVSVSSAVTVCLNLASVDTSSPAAVVITPLGALNVTEYVTPVQHAYRVVLAAAVRLDTLARSPNDSPASFVHFSKPQPSRVNAQAVRFVGTS